MLKSIKNIPLDSLAQLSRKDMEADLINSRVGIEAVKRYNQRPYSLNPPLINKYSADTQLLNKLDLSEQKARLANEQSGILTCQKYNEFKGILQPNSSPPSPNLASSEMSLHPSIEEK